MNKILCFHIFSSSVRTDKVLIEDLVQAKCGVYVFNWPD